MSYPNFDRDFDWALEMQQRHAIEKYRERWPGCDIVECDKAGLTEEVAQLLDFSGVDKMIRIENGAALLMSQRFRRADTGTDFSLCYERVGSDNPSEHERLINVWKDDLANLPEMYAFGVAKQNPLENGFKEFYLFNMEALVSAIAEGRVKQQGPYDSYDGSTRAIYIDTDELRDAGCIDSEWKSNNTETKSSGQTGLDAFTDGGQP